MILRRGPFGSPPGPRWLIDRMAEPLDPLLTVLLESPDSGVMAVDRTGRTVRANRWLHRVTGGTPGLAPGEVSAFYNPPTDGELVVTTAGAGDPECVIDCSHFLAEVGTYADYGPVHTLILTNDEGVPSSLDLWEQPAVTYGNANEMVPADPSAGIVVVTGYAVDDADFGLRMAVVGTPGCVEPFNLAGVLIGGNQTPAFLLPSASVQVTIHDNNDRECTGTPVGGPFALEVAAGERAHVILHGSVADGVDAIILPME